jgi:Polyketide cyclase / dehydrase and lipid transport
MPEQISVERTIRAGARELYELIADLPRMGEWSPENTGGRWVKGSSGPTVGAHFRGSNRKGVARWTTNVVVTVADPGGEFSFDVSLGPMRIANWHYRFEELAGGKTLVVETWTDHRLPVLGTIVNLTIGVRDRQRLNRANMEATLANLAAAVEV